MSERKNVTRIAHVLDKQWRSSDIKTDDDTDFSSLLLSDTVLYGLKSAGFVRPSPVQFKAIPLGRAGCDLIVQAKSGTGKTCVFAVIALEKLLLESKATQALVLAPTREVAVQICEVVQGLGTAFKGLQCHAFIGGMPVNEDKIRLKKCHIAVGTPGRIKQLIKEDVLKTFSIRLFVLDEADKLLEEGFQESINWIYSSLPVRKQMLALSATYTEELANLLHLYMHNPSIVRLNLDQPALIGVAQFYSSTPYSPMQHISFQSKIQALTKVLKTVTFSQCLVFSNYQTRAESLCDVLRKQGWPTDFISGGQQQCKRLHAIDQLKQFKCRVLVSTDVTSRGIDVENVNLVVNMDVPWDVETYLHRIGRAGRFGTRGIAISFVSGEEETTLFHEIRTTGNLDISVLPDPMPDDLWSFAYQMNMNNKSQPSGCSEISDNDLILSQERDVMEACANTEPRVEVLGSASEEDKQVDNQLKDNVNSDSSEQEEILKEDPQLNVSNSQPSTFCYDELMRDFPKSLQQLDNEDKNVESSGNVDEETEELLSLNSFLVNNREEYRYQLKSELDKRDNELLTNLNSFLNSTFEEYQVKLKDGFMNSKSQVLVSELADHSSYSLCTNDMVFDQVSDKQCELDISDAAKPTLSSNQVLLEKTDYLSMFLESDKAVEGLNKQIGMISDPTEAAAFSNMVLTCAGFSSGCNSSDDPFVCSEDEGKMFKEKNVNSRFVPSTSIANVQVGEEIEEVDSQNVRNINKGDSKVVQDKNENSSTSVTTEISKTNAESEKSFPHNFKKTDLSLSADLSAEQEEDQPTKDVSSLLEVPLSSASERTPSDKRTAKKNKGTTKRDKNKAAGSKKNLSSQVSMSFETNVNTCALSDQSSTLSSSERVLAPEWEARPRPRPNTSNCVHECFPAYISENTPPCYEGHLKQWWKPNTRMAVQYMEQYNYMSHLIRYRFKHLL